MYMEEEVKLLVTQQGESLVITNANLTAKDTYELVILLVDSLSKVTGQEYNQVLEDLREIEDGE